MFVYYVFNSRVNIIYCYECPDPITMFETGITQDILDIAKERFSKADKLLFHEDYIFIVNGNRYQMFSGPKNAVAKEKMLAEMNGLTRRWYKGIVDRGIDRGIDTPSIGSKTEIETEIKYETETDKKREDVRPEDIPEEVWLKRAFEKKRI